MERTEHQQPDDADAPDDTDALDDTDPPAEPAPVLRARGARVDDRRRPLLPTTTLEVARGELLLAHGDPTHAHTALALALAGRLPLDAGAISLDEDERPRTRRRRVALVDVPGVSEPDDLVPTTTVVGEELAMAGRRARRRDVRDWLHDQGLADLVGTSVEEVPGPERVLLLSRLAALRPVDFLVVVLPERHAVLPTRWAAPLRDLAASGPGVVVTASTGVSALAPREIRLSPFGVLEEAPA